MKHDTRKTIILAFLMMVVFLTASAVGATYDAEAIDPVGPGFSQFCPIPPVRRVNRPGRPPGDWPPNRRPWRR